MTDLVITATEVLVSTDTITEDGVTDTGVTVTAGQVCYKDATSGKYKLFDTNSSTANARSPVLSMNGGAPGQTVRFARSGTVTIGATAAPVLSTIYIASATPGGIAPAADLASTWKTVIIGVCNGTGTLKLVLANSGAVKA